jgi:allophanate hydrolase subunit 1
MYCQYCGTELPDVAGFCQKCGKARQQPVAAHPQPSYEVCFIRTYEGTPFVAAVVEQREIARVKCFPAHKMGCA